MNEKRVSNSGGAFQSRSYPLRWYLMMLVAGALLPMLLLSAAVIHRISENENLESQRRLELASRDLGWAVDREVTSTVRTLAALSESAMLDSGNVRGFYVEAKRAAATQPTWRTTILLSPDGQQILNTNFPYGKRLPAANEPTSLKKLAATLKPAIGNLARGKVQRAWAFPVRVPVVRGGKLKYVLTAVITPRALLSVIQKYAPAEGEWTRTVVDSKGVIVARTRRPEYFVGRSASPTFLQKAALRQPMLSRDVSLDGVPVYLAMAPVADWGWTVSVAVPAAILEAPGRRALSLILALGGALVVLSAAGAFLLARRLSRAIVTSSAAAEGLTRGQKPQMQPTRLAEVDSLADSLGVSFELLEQRERERDENLARAEAALRQAEAALARAEEASRLKDEFLATVSHELRTPLTAILGWAHLLRAGHVDEDEKAATLMTIERNARALSGLVDDLLDASRIINGQLSIERRVVDFREAIADAIDTIRPVAEESGITVSMRSNGECFVLGEQRRLLQIVLNLLANAVKFTHYGGRIDVELDTHGDSTTLSVRDTGEGISPQFLPHIFDRFRQADSSASRRSGGLGLGLAIVKNLVELHGGTVRAESAGIDRGSEFIVTLPTVLPDSEKQAAPA